MKSVQCFANFWIKSLANFFLFSIGKGYYTRITGIEKNPGKEPPAIVFFCSISTLIQSGSIQSCLATEKRFYYLKAVGL
jgi:hypothetical protein